MRPPHRREPYAGTLGVAKHLDSSVTGYTRHDGAIIAFGLNLTASAQTLRQLSLHERPLASSGLLRQGVSLACAKCIAR